MILRVWNREEDYKELVRWWESHKWPAVPSSHLPETGFIAQDDRSMIAACWLYLTGTTFSVLEWVVTNPDRSARCVHRGVSELVAKVPMVAVSSGATHVVSSLRSSGLKKVFNKNGFITGDREMTTMVWGS